MDEGGTTLNERPPQFSLRLDIFKSKKEMIEITEKGHTVTNYTQSVANHDDFLMYVGTEIFDFISGTVKEVTDKDSVKTPELYAAQARLGFIVAPHPSAFAIRNVYEEQLFDDWRSVLSEPVPGSDGRLAILHMARDSFSSFLCGRYAYPDLSWRGDARLWLCRKLE